MALSVPLAKTETVINTVRRRFERSDTQSIHRKLLKHKRKKLRNKEQEGVTNRNILCHLSTEICKVMSHPARVTTKVLILCRCHDSDDKV